MTTAVPFNPLLSPEKKIMDIRAGLPAEAWDLEELKPAYASAVALSIASDAFAGTVRRNGRPYMDHVTEVAFAFRDDPERQAMAYLHDIVEDTPWTPDQLREAGFSSYIVEGVIALSKNEDEAYFDFVERLSHNQGASPVKLEDLKSNAQALLDTFKGATAEKYHRYRVSYQYLLAVERKAINSGTSMINFAINHLFPQIPENEQSVIQEIIKKHSGRQWPKAALSTPRPS